MNCVSQLLLNGCAWIESDLTNKRKREAWDDVTKRYLFHKTAISTNLLMSFKY